MTNFYGYPTQPSLGTDGELGPINFQRYGVEELQSYETALCGLGTKNRPKVDTRLNAHFHPDGLFAEFAPQLPSEDVESFLATVTRSRARLESLMGMRLCGYDYIDVSQIPAYSEDTCPRLVKLANTFGCSPDAIRGRWRIVPPAVKKGTIKEAGCHLHLTLPERYCDRRTKQEKEAGVHPTNLRIAAQIAEELYEATSFLHMPNVREVRSWYRVPRVYRPKPYGIEYRSLGATVYDSPDKLAMLAQIAFTFMRDTFKTASRSVYV